MRGRHRYRGRAPLSALTVVGEMLVVSGLVVAGYLLWQPWYTGVVVVNQQAKIAAAASAKLNVDEIGDTGDETPPEPSGVPVALRAAENDTFAVMYLPAFGDTFANVVAEGVSRSEVLNVSEKGIGHYDTTQMPGEAGNFAVAAHRSGPRTTPFKEIMNLRVGDAIYVRTAEGWYTYRFRSIEYVLPEENDVLLPFPRIDGTPGDDQILTLTTCHPKDFGADERAIAYAVFDDFRPANAGAPPALSAVNPAVGAA